LHRRAGKTTASLNHLQRDALSSADTRYAYIAPTYKQAKNIAWDELKKYALVVPGVKFNEAELRCDYPNGSRITLYGADNPDSLRGITLHGVVFDEYSQQPSNIFSEIIAPTLATTNGYAIWIGTPKGKNEFYRLYTNATQDDTQYSLLLKASESGLISQEELSTQRKFMSEDEFNQEYECSFEAAIQGAYYAKQINEAREQNRFCEVPYEPALPVHTWWDLGIGDATVILFMQHTGIQWRIIDSYEASGEPLIHYIKTLKEKPYGYGEHYAPHDIQVKELGTGLTRYEVAQNHGLNFNVVPRMGIDDGIQAVRMRFNSLWIDEKKNSKFIDALAQYRKEWDDKRGEFKNKPLHDWTSHFADALRYWAVTDFQTPNKNFELQVSRNRQRNMSFK
jgi:phage terminase large subunit